MEGEVYKNYLNLKHIIIDMQNVTLEMVYEELKDVNQKITSLEHLLIPEEKLSEAEMKKLDRILEEARAGKAIPFSAVKK